MLNRGLLCQKRKRSTYNNCHKTFACCTGLRHTLVHLQISVLRYVMSSSLSSPLLLKSSVLPVGESAFVLITDKHRGYYINISAASLFSVAAWHRLCYYSQYLTGILLFTILTFRVRMEDQFTVILLPCVLICLETSPPKGVTAESVTPLPFCNMSANHSSLSKPRDFRWGRLRRELQAKISSWACATEVNTFTVDFSRYRNSLEILFTSFNRTDPCLSFYALRLYQWCFKCHNLFQTNSI